MTARSFSDLVGRQLRTSAGKADSRKKLVGAVHAAARALAEDDRRAIYVEVTGKRTLTEMTLAEIGAVLDRLNKGRARPMQHRPHQAKIRALWWTLYWLGEIAEPTDAALDAFVARQAKVASLRFVDHRRAPAVIEALKSWCARSGVSWPAPSAAAAARSEAGDAIAERRAVVDAIWLKLVHARVALRTSCEAYIAAALAISTDRRTWTAYELDAAIKLLGKMLRRSIAKAGGP